MFYCEGQDSALAAATVLSDGLHDKLLDELNSGVMHNAAMVGGYIHIHYY